MSLLNNIKNAVRKKKLYFTVNHSKKNINTLYFYLINNIITSFSKNSNQFLTAFINYNNDFNNSITKISNLKKISKQQNNIINSKFMHSNFIISTFTTNKYNIKSKKKLTHFVKFK
jgi:ribosomal protein S8